MKLTIAFLQLLPTGSLKGNMEKGIKARAIVLRPFRRFMKEVEKGKGVKA